MDCLPNWLHASQLDILMSTIDIDLMQELWNNSVWPRGIMSTESFKEHLALKFLDKYLEEENVCSSDTDTDDIIENANHVAEAVYLYVNAMLAGLEGQKIEVKPQVQAVPRPSGSGLLGLRGKDE